MPGRRGTDRLVGGSASSPPVITGGDAVTAACTTSSKELLGLLEGASSEWAVPVFRVAGDRSRCATTCGRGCSTSWCTARHRLQGPRPHDAGPTLARHGGHFGVRLELARARVGDLGTLRGFTRTERALPDLLRVL